MRSAEVLRVSVGTGLAPNSSTPPLWSPKGSCSREIELQLLAPAQLPLPFLHYIFSEELSNYLSWQSALLDEWMLDAVSSLYLIQSGVVTTPRVSPSLCIFKTYSQQCFARRRTSEGAELVPIGQEPCRTEKEQGLGYFSYDVNVSVQR